jgi:hypothetical protein
VEGNGLPAGLHALYPEDIHAIENVSLAQRNQAYDRRLRTAAVKSSTATKDLNDSPLQIFADMLLIQVAE